MIRPVTAICMLAAGASGLYLYQTKHRAVMLDRQIMSVLKQTEATRERIGMMRAEWALLNEPERLAELSGKHLGLRTLAPTQFASVADFGSRLPPPVAPGTPYPPTEDMQQLPSPAPAAVPPAAAGPAAAVPVPRIAARSAPVQASAPAQPVQVASSTPARPSAAPRLPRAEARDDVPATPRPAQAAPLPNPAVAARSAAPVVSVAAAPILAPRASAPGIGEAVAARAAAAARTPVAQPAWTPGPAPLPAASASQGYAAQYAPVQYSPAHSALGQSALGGARASLPPPVPYSAQPR